MMAGGQIIDPDAVAFLTAAGITDATISSAINILVLDLKSYGIWTKMKAIYPFVGGFASTHKFNLKNPQDTNAAFRLTFLGGWTHSANGAQPNGTNAYANTFLTPSANQSLTSGHFSLYSRTLAASIAGAGTNGSSGVRDNASPTRASYITVRSSSNASQTVMWGDGLGNETPVVTSTDARGFYISTRTAANSLIFLRNNSVVSSATSNQTITVLSSFSYFLSGINYSGSPLNNGYDNKELAFASIGDGLNNTEAADFYTAVQAFQTTLGRQV